MRRTCQHLINGEECGKPAVDFMMYYSFSFGSTDPDEEDEDTGIHETKYWYCAEHYDRLEAAKKAFIQG